MEVRLQSSLSHPGLIPVNMLSAYRQMTSGGYAGYMSLPLFNVIMNVRRRDNMVYRNSYIYGTDLRRVLWTCMQYTYKVIRYFILQPALLSFQEE